VLGSAQTSAEFDADRCVSAGLELVKRRSGGGAVVVLPGAQVWLDLFVPASDQLFDNDVVRASSFVGALWRDALVAATGSSAGLAVHTDGLVATAWSRRICFSGLGPGELTRSGRKVTGLAQRRDRTGAWFFTMALVRPEQHRLASLLAVDAGEAAAIETSLEAETVVAGCPAAELERTLAAGLGGVWSPGEDVPAEPHPGERED
jgi:lipoate-protein ligase A